MNKRAFVIVIDSLGVGYDTESSQYGDKGANTLGHIFEATGGKNKIPTLQKLGLCNIIDVKGNDKTNSPLAYFTKMHEASIGKDTMTGHWEMMGVLTTIPFKTFTDTGFPQSLHHAPDPRKALRFHARADLSERSQARGRRRQDRRTRADQ